MPSLYAPSDRGRVRGRERDRVRDRVVLLPLCLCPAETAPASDAASVGRSEAPLRAAVQWVYAKHLEGVARD